MRVGRGARAWAISVAISACAAALVPAVATAGTVSVGPDGVVTFQAEPGETNDVSYSHSGGDIYISDAGAQLTVGGGCTRNGASAARCPGERIVIDAGDLDDAVAYTGGGSPADDRVMGGEGDDTLAGNVEGGPGDDTLEAMGPGAVADGGPGDDTLSASDGGHGVSGGEGDDRITVAWVEVADGGPGNDVIESSGTTTLRGGAGNDSLVRHGEASCEGCVLNGEAMDGGAGDDELEGFAGPELLDGGPGDDTLHGGGGHDLLLGGDGDDTIDVGGTKLPGNTWSALPPSGSQPPDLVRPPDSLVDGGAGADRLQGGPNYDSMHGGEGDDVIDGGDGNDLVDGGPGADLIDGGPGAVDRVDFTDQPGPVTIDLTQPGGDGGPGEDDTYLPSIEYFLLSEGDDRFVAGTAPETVYGGLGDDRLVGGPAADLLYGDTLHGQFGDRPGRPYGNDRIDGRGGDDRIDGDAGDDDLRGGPGDDVVGGGRDVIVVQRTSTRYPNDDVIHGGRGDDALYSGRADGVLGQGGRIFAGPGNDTVWVRSFYASNISPVLPLGHGDSAACGGGRDIVVGDYYDEVGLTCEVYREGTTPWRAIRPNRHGQVTLTVRCLWDYGRSCRGRARLIRAPVAAPGRVAAFSYADFATGARPSGCRAAPKRVSLGGGRFRIRAGRVDHVTLRLSRRGRRTVARAGCLAVRAVMRFRDPAHRSHVMTRTLSLRAPR